MYTVWYGVIQLMDGNKASAAIIFPSAQNFVPKSSLYTIITGIL